MTTYIFVAAGAVAFFCELYTTRQPWHWAASTVTLGVGLP